MDLLEHLSFWKQGGAGARFLLGIMATEKLLHAVLIERGEDATQIVRRFSRQRGADYTGSDPALPPPIPGQADEHEGEDFTLQFGSDGGNESGNLFLGSEFGDIDDQGSFVGDPDRTPAPSFALELSDILEECRDAGFDDLAVVLAQPASDIHSEELRLHDVSGEPSRKQLRNALNTQYDGVIQDERTAFIPMTPTDDEVTRYLAVIARERDHIIKTLEDINEQDVSDLPRNWTVDTELTLFYGIARSILRRELRDIDHPDDHHTLVVRVGEKDTLALFLQGESLLHAEMLRSLTSFDPPETVCSRVLLLQDEYEMGDMDRVMLIGENEEELAGSFEMFFVDAEVEILRDHLPGGEEARDTPSDVAVPATAAALRLADHGGFQAFLIVDILPKGIIRRRFTMPFGWEVPALYAAIFLITMLFMARFFALDSDIRSAERELDQYPDTAMLDDPSALQAQIDSMQAVSDGYMRGIEALDQLLVGSDRWSTSLAKISRETAAVQGAWVESWRPGEQTVVLMGNATSRDHVVQLAERTQGDIRQVVFSEIREWPVYSFEVEVDLPNELPGATVYLRERMAERLEEGELDLQLDPATTPTAPASYEDGASNE